MKQVICFILILSSVALAQLPDSPKPQRNKSDRLFSKKYIASTVALFGSEVYDAEVSHAGIQRGRCSEAFGDPHSSRGQLYARMLPIDGVLFGFSLLMKKAKVPVAPYVPLLMGSARHVYVGSEWFSWGCM